MQESCCFAAVRSLLHLQYDCKSTAGACPYHMVPSRSNASSLGSVVLVAILPADAKGLSGGDLEGRLLSAVASTCMLRWRQRGTGAINLCCTTLWPD